MEAEDALYMTRTYQLDEKDSVEIRVWPPRRDPEYSETWMCEYQIVGIGTGKKRRSGGVDPIQSLYLGLIHISTALYCSQEYKDGRLTLCGATTKFDLALPVLESIREEVDRDRKALEEAAG